MPDRIHRTAILLLASLVLFAGQGWADFIIMKDGYTLRGKLMIEGQILRDPSGKEFWIKKLGGFYVLDDGARRAVFSSRQVSEARPDPSEREAPETFTFKPPLMRTEFSRSLRSVKVESAEPWKSSGERSITLVNDLVAGDSKSFEQCIVSLTPHYLRASARRVRWDASYLVDEIEPETLLSLIRQQLAKRDPPASKLDEQLAIIRFCRQAGWIGEASSVMSQLLEEFPDEKERLAGQALELKKRINHSRLEACELALAAGQYDRLDQLLAGFPLEATREADATRVVSMQNQMKELQAKLESSRRQLAAVVKDVQDQGLLTGCADLLAEMESGLNRDTCRRLDAFVLLSLQEDRRRAAGQKPMLSPEQLLALALSGWVLGNAGAESDAVSALRLVQTRRFLTSFLNTVDNRERTQLLERYLKGESLSTDVLAQLIAMLPPPTPPEAPPAEGAELTTEGSRGIPYRLLLPPEYHPHREYPLLIALPNVKEDAQSMLTRCRDLAARHGYVLAVPQWADSLQEKYQSTDREQDVVPYLIRDLRRRFNVDPDKVFLLGYDQSGTLAYDVGLAHPDLFAGVIIICGRPGKLGRSYRYNSQYLPFYVVEGERSPNNTGENRDMFEYWVNRGFPSIYVEYAGRGLEFYPGELPYIFDWMSRKRRSSGLPELGGPDPDGGSLGREFRSERHTDNRFYWISTEDLAVGNNRVATVTARLAPGQNAVVVQQTGYRQISVWLNSAMVDFEQPVEVRVNPGSGTGKTFKGLLTADPRVLLEDFYQRGDRRNLYTARVDFK